MKQQHKTEKRLDFVMLTYHGNMNGCFQSKVQGGVLFDKRANPNAKYVNLSKQEPFLEESEATMKPGRPATSLGSLGTMFSICSKSNLRMLRRLNAIESVCDAGYR
jgi:hypothetical protein